LGVTSRVDRAGGLPVLGEEERVRSSRRRRDVGRVVHLAEGPHHARLEVDRGEHAVAVEARGRDRGPQLPAGQSEPARLEEARRDRRRSEARHRQVDPDDRAGGALGDVEVAAVHDHAPGSVDVRDRRDDVPGVVEHLDDVRRRPRNEDLAARVVDDDRAEADRAEVVARCGRGGREYGRDQRGAGDRYEQKDATQVTAAVVHGRLS
jgi:hypothetical protein